MRRTVCRTAAALLVVTIAACGTPDATRFQAPDVTPTTLSAETTSLGSEESSDSLEPSSTSAAAVTSSSAEPPPSTVDPAVALGAEQVVPWGMVTADDISRAVAQVASMTVRQKAGSVVMASSGTAVGSSEVADLGLAGVNLLGTRGVLDGTADGTPSQVAEVTAGFTSPLAGFPLLIATDQEYGDVTRLINGFTDLPGAGQLGAIDDLERAADLTRRAAGIAASEMAAVGINLDFAPVSDVLPLRGSSAIADRSYGSDPARVAALVAAAVGGYQDGGVAATLKHFPGIGAVAADSHVTLSTVTADCAEWNERSAAPVRSGVDAGVSLVMTGHTLFPAVDTGSEPTSLSSVILRDLLRGDPAVPLPSGCTPVGFRGLAISDSLVMAPIANSYGVGESAWRSVAAGEDIVLMPASPAAAVDGIVGAVDGGQLAETRLNDAAVRVFALRSALSRSPRPDLATVGSDANAAAAAEIWAAVG